MNKVNWAKLQIGKSSAMEHFSGFFEVSRGHSLWELRKR